MTWASIALVLAVLGIGYAALASVAVALNHRLLATVVSFVLSTCAILIMVVYLVKDKVHL